MQENLFNRMVDKVAIKLASAEKNNVYLQCQVEDLQQENQALREQLAILESLHSNQEQPIEQED